MDLVNGSSKFGISCRRFEILVRMTPPYCSVCLVFGSSCALWEGGVTKVNSWTFHAQFFYIPEGQILRSLLAVQRGIGHVQYPFQKGAIEEPYKRSRLDSRVIWSDTDT